MRRHLLSFTALLCVFALLIGCTPKIPPAADPAPPQQEQSPSTDEVPSPENPPAPDIEPISDSGQNESASKAPSESGTASAPEEEIALTPEPSPEIVPSPEPEVVPEPTPEPEEEIIPEHKPKTLTTLMYHDFMPDGVPPTDWVITTDMFREDLQWLKDNGYTTVLPRELAGGMLDSGEPLPDKMVMLTFDDGYTSNYTLAMPLLEEFGMKAAVALIVSHIDRGEPGFLTWEQCREMNASGLFEFGSHTYDHHIREGINGVARLEGESREAYTERIRTDIVQSVVTIETELGAPVTYFAYPLGKVDSWANGILAEFVTVSVTSNRGKADITQGLYRLPRYNVTARERAAGFVQ